MYKIKNQFKALLATLVLLVLVSGCVGTKNTSQTLYASLDSATTLYNATYDVLEKLDAAGSIKQENKPKIKDLMIQAEAALIASSNALKVYVDNSTDENKISFELSLQLLNSLITDVCVFIGGK